MSTRVEVEHLTLTDDRGKNVFRLVVVGGRDVFFDGSPRVHLGSVERKGKVRLSSSMAEATSGERDLARRLLRTVAGRG